MAMDRNEILLLVPAISNRLRYVVRHLEETLKISFRFQTPGEPAPLRSAAVISYGKIPVAQSANIWESGLMNETGLNAAVPDVFIQNGQVMMFRSPEGFEMPFDVFSALFFMLSRYEEYRPHKSDIHGRFQAEESLAFRQGFLLEPVVDQWTMMFGHLLLKRFPSLSITTPRYSFLSTLDIDSPWAYLHKGIWRTAGGLFRALQQGNIGEFSRRLNVILGADADPFDVYDWLEEIETRQGFRSFVFLLMAGCGNYDTNQAAGSHAFARLVASLGSTRNLGIHPSYRAARSDQALKKEFKLFGKLTGSAPAISRQHFLRLSLPETYRKLVELGIQTDFSMGYAGQPGFRAGTGRPFMFYDLLLEKETDLQIQPFAVMDVTLRQYLKLGPDEAGRLISALISRCRKSGSMFVSLWHNESISDEGIWKGWRSVFLKMTEEANRLAI